MLDHDNPLEEVFEDQLLCADLVVLNKCDLVSDAARDGVEDDLRRSLRPAVKLFATSHGIVSNEVLLGLSAAAEDDLEGRPSHHDGAPEDHDHDDFDSFTMALGPVPDAAGFAARLAALAADHDILRIKGFIEVPEKALRLLVQGVGGRVQHHFDRPWRADEDREGRLVVIGLKGIDRPGIEAAVRAAAASA